MPNSKMERFTQRTRRVLLLAQEEAVSMQHNEIGTEHILLGLIREEGSIAARVLRDLGVQYTQVRSIVKDSNKSSRSSNLDLAFDSKKLLEFAVDEARRRGHSFIGTEHLLMALTRQSHSKAFTTLKHLNVDITDVYQRANKLLFNDQTATFPAFASIAMIAVISTAQQEAAQLNSRSIEPEHLFLALLHDTDGAASCLIHELNLNHEQIRGMTRIIKRQMPQATADLPYPTLSHESQELLKFSYSPYGCFPDQLLKFLVRDWWILKDVWEQRLLKPQQVQDALNRAQVVGIVRYPHDFNLAEYLQLYVNFFFPPPLRRAVRSFTQNLRNKRTGKQP